MNAMPARRGAPARCGRAIPGMLVAVLAIQAGVCAEASKPAGAERGEAALIGRLGMDLSRRYSSPLTRRIDEIHKVTYEKWIVTAWAAMLMRQGVIPREHAPEIAAFLLDRWKPDAQGRYVSPVKALQAELIEARGADVGGSILMATVQPPARQMLGVRHHLLKEMCMLHALQQALLDAAAKHAGAVMPGYTHARQAQPTTLGHYLLSVHDPIERGMKTLEDAFHLMSLSELGAGALAGTSVPIDRDLAAGYLGMEGLIENSNDAQAYSDGYVVLVAGLANIMNVASRMALELNYWSGEQYGFIDFEYRGKSMMMPQKNNNQSPLELVRVGAAKMQGHLAEVSAMGMRCPHGDCVDMLHMQDAPLEALATLDVFLHRMIQQLQGMRANGAKMLAAASAGYSCATEVANHLVLHHKLDYLTAHDLVFEFVAESERRGIPASEADAAILDECAQKALGRRLGMGAPALRKLLDPAAFIHATGSQGGVAPAEVGRMLEQRRARLEEARQRHMGRIQALEDAQKRLVDDLRAIDDQS